MCLAAGMISPGFSAQDSAQGPILRFIDSQSEFNGAPYFKDVAHPSYGNVDACIPVYILNAKETTMTLNQLHSEYHESSVKKAGPGNGKTKWKMSGDIATNKNNRKIALGYYSYAFKMVHSNTWVCMEEKKNGGRIYVSTASVTNGISPIQLLKTIEKSGRKKPITMLIGRHGNILQAINGDGKVELMMDDQFLKSTPEAVSEDYEADNANKLDVKYIGVQNIFDESGNPAYIGGARGINTRKSNAEHLRKLIKMELNAGRDVIFQWCYSITAFLELPNNSTVAEFEKAEKDARNTPINEMISKYFWKDLLENNDSDGVYKEARTTAMESGKFKSMDECNYNQYKDMEKVKMAKDDTETDNKALEKLGFVLGGRKKKRRKINLSLFAGLNVPRVPRVPGLRNRLHRLQGADGGM